MASKRLVGLFVGTSFAVWAWYNTEVQPLPIMNQEPDREAEETFRQNFICSKANIQDGRSYTLLTSCFAHEGFTHLAVNMTGLWGFGQTVATCFGPINFLALYMGSGILGSQAFLYADRIRKDGIERGGLGASGSVLGLVTAVACFRPRGKMELFFIPMASWFGVLSMATWSLLAIKFGWQSWMGHEAHLGGMAFGALWYFAMVRGRKPF